MQGKPASIILLLLLVVSALVLTRNVQPVKSNYAWTQTIYIQADGSIQPPTAPISSVNNVTYTLTDSIAGNVPNGSQAIVILRDNVIIDGAGYTLQGAHASISEGIGLTGRGNVTIQNVKIAAFDIGIFLYSSNNSDVSGNSIANNGEGIWLWSSSNDSVRGNNITNNSIGIYFSSSSNISLSGNSFVNDGLLVYGSYGNVVTGNLVNGKPLVYLEEVSGYAVGDAGQVVLVECNNVTVENLNLCNTTTGVELWETNNTKISGNNIMADSYGIYSWSSSNNSVSGNNITANNAAGIITFFSNNDLSGNNITNNWYGIMLDSSSNNSVSGNNITANIAVGIYLYSASNNTVYHNNFINDTSQVYSYDSTNVWDNGYPSGGNYWSDYNGTDEKSGPSQDQPGYDGMGDMPYIIASSSNNTIYNSDNYPLMQPLTGQGVLTMQTPAGSNVTVSPMLNVSVTFANVTGGGFTSWNTVQPPTDQFVSVTCNEIRTSANYTGNVTLKFGYDPSGLSLKDQQATKIWLWNDSAKCWIDITTFVNTTSHIVYGLSPHLSMFGVTSDLGISGDLGVQGTTTVSLPSAPPAPPHSLAALNYYQINTTKSLSTPINLSLAYNYGNIPPEEEIFTQMWMWNESSASWVDITTGFNTTSHMVYGSAPHLSMFGVTSLPQPPNGIAVTSANCPKTVVCQGYSANINVTIRNQGGFPQTDFNVTLFCNATLLGTYHVDQLGIGGQITLNFTWNTGGWAKGNYSISTYSDHIGWVYVSMVGDITGGTPFVPDGTVDGRDISTVAKCFGCVPGDLRWNANCDINNDGSVDGKDISTVARHFGEGGP